MDISSISTTIQETIKTFESNPIIPLVASGGLTVWVITNLKMIWHAVTGFIISLISFNIYNTYEDGAVLGYATQIEQDEFNKIVNESRVIWERTKELDFNRKIGQQWDRDLLVSNITFGFSIRIMYGKLVLCYRSHRPDNNKLMVTTNLQVFFGRKTKFIARLKDDIAKRKQIRTEKTANRNDVFIFYPDGNTAASKSKRNLDSIFTDNDKHLELYDSISKFIENKSVYQKLNYPYKYSALIYGKPGTGKSSTILAIASKLNRDVEYVNLATTSVAKLIERLNLDTDRKIFVFEDIDALNSDAFNERSQNNVDSAADDANKAIAVSVKERNVNITEKAIKLFSMSLSDLLNITDGLLSSDGAICIFTTNHIEKLDNALLRPGRMNKLIEFGYMSHETANRMIKTYLGFELENLKDDIKPAELQEAILNILLKKADNSILDKFTKNMI